MLPLLLEVSSQITPESLVEALQGQPGIVLLRSGLFASISSRYSFVAARPFLTFRSWGSRCELALESGTQTQFADPWQLLDQLLPRYELKHQIDLPFPLGGCFGYWGYELKNFLEPKLRRRISDDLQLPESHLGFYSSLVIFDHRLGKTWIVSTGMGVDGSCHDARAQQEAATWQRFLAEPEASGSCEMVEPGLTGPASPPMLEASPNSPKMLIRMGTKVRSSEPLYSNLSRPDFLGMVERAQAYIRSGHIYQVNLCHRLAAPFRGSGWELFQRLSAVSPAPFSAYFDCGEYQIASSSPELFLRISGPALQTCPIKGTRPRSKDPIQDAQFAYALQTSPKEMAELVMITDLLRNDLGRICQYGSVHVPELARLERYPQVLHLVSTVEGRLTHGISHLRALAGCFPGGSVTGAPKFRAMEIIDELEPVSRGPYTGALGYLGFNHESQLSIIIRTAVFKDQTAYFPVGAGIVADSDPAAEYDETLAKAAGFSAALRTKILIKQQKDLPTFPK
jgi:para-aminobenzoate synthetase component 1